MLALKHELKNTAHQKSQIEQNFEKLREEKDGETKNLEEKLVEANDKVSILTIENKNLYAILDTKETIIKEMNESSDKASLTEMKVRLDATEKENSNLKYELHMAQKELEIRNKERDYNIKTAEAAYKQQMESLKKVSKLETECNKLRMMLRKRLPGPGAIAKMRNELGLNSNNSMETRKKSSSLLVEKLHVIEEENRVLKETLARKNDDTMSCVTESWATTFISELEHFKEDKLEGSNSDFGIEEDQFQNYPSWLKDIVRVIIKKHYVIQISVKKIIEEVLDALKKTGFYTEEEKYVERCIDDHKSMEVTDKTSAAPENSDLCVTKETYKSTLSNVEVTNNPSKEVESQGSSNPDLEANKVTNSVNNGIRKECDEEVHREIGERHDNLNLEKENNEEKELKEEPDELDTNASKEAKEGSEYESESKLERSLHSHLLSLFLFIKLNYYF
jgi:Filament-like plant protein, long coiled-coil